MAFDMARWLQSACESSMHAMLVSSSCRGAPSVSGVTSDPKGQPLEAICILNGPACRLWLVIACVLDMMAYCLTYAHIQLCAHTCVA